jgi:hypothetical protein
VHQCFPLRLPLPKNRKHDKYIDVFKVYDTTYFRNRLTNEILEKHRFNSIIRKRIKKYQDHGWIVTNIWD